MISSRNYPPLDIFWPRFHITNFQSPYLLLCFSTSFSIYFLCPPNGITRFLQHVFAPYPVCLLCFQHLVLDSMLVLLFSQCSTDGKLWNLQELELKKSLRFSQGDGFSTSLLPLHSQFQQKQTNKKINT